MSHDRRDAVLWRLLGAQLTMLLHGRPARLAHFMVRVHDFWPSLDACTPPTATNLGGKLATQAHIHRTHAGCDRAHVDAWVGWLGELYTPSMCTHR